jgi:hypothetical protein
LIAERIPGAIGTSQFMAAVRSIDRHSILTESPLELRAASDTTGRRKWRARSILKARTGVHPDFENSILVAYLVVPGFRGDTASR